MSRVDETSYKSPFYAELSSGVEREFGLPQGLLSAIVLRGERSNADQVSEAGARTVFQITPGTRNAALEKFGTDAYLSPENAARVAGRLLKESLARNDGDLAAAVAEYHGGTERSNWGPRTKSYVNRVMAGLAPASRMRGAAGNSDPGAAAGAPNLARVYQAYRDGRMGPEQEATFEQAVQAGEIELPRGASLRRKEEAVPVAPEALIKAYVDGTLPPEKAALFAEAVHAGELQMSGGATLPRKGSAGAAAAPAAPPGIGERLAELPGAIREGITGEKRRTAETDSLPEWTSMPELNELSGASMRAGGDDVRPHRGDSEDPASAVPGRAAAARREGEHDLPLVDRQQGVRDPAGAHPGRPAARNWRARRVHAGRPRRHTARHGRRQRRHTGGDRG